MTGWTPAVEAALARKAQIIMLTGPSAAGKTTTAHKLAERIAARGLRSAVMSLDDFLRRRRPLPQAARRQRRLRVASNRSICPCCAPACAAWPRTGVCEAPVFSFLTQRPTGQTRTIDARGGIAIVEGLHAFNPALAVDELPAGTALHLYAGLREEYARGGRFPRAGHAGYPPGPAAHARYCCSAAMTPISRCGCGRTSARRRTNTSKPSKTAPTSCSIPRSATKSACGKTTPRKCTPPPTPRACGSCAGRFAAFPPLPGAVVPADSLLRELSALQTGMALENDEKVTKNS